MSLLIASFLIGIENHEGKYIPSISDIKPFIGVEAKGTTTAPSGSVRANSASSISASYGYLVTSSNPNTKIDCNVIKELCANVGQCRFQKMKYILVGGSSIGETNAILSISHNYSYGLFHPTSSIYFNECFGMSWKNITAIGTVQAK